MISKEELEQLYIENKRSVSYIAKSLKCSETAVNYWLKKYSIHKRSISDAIYLKRNPYGNPFKPQKPQNIRDAIILGLGMGLYWREANKSSKLSVRLASADAALIQNFILFLKSSFQINDSKLKYGLQVSHKTDIQEAMIYWQQQLGADKSQFQKVIVSSYRGEAQYNQKNKYGVLTIFYHNKRLRDIICKMIENM